MTAQIIPFPTRLSPEPAYVQRMRGYAEMIRRLREEEREYVRGGRAVDAALERRRSARNSASHHRPE